MFLSIRFKYPLLFFFIYSKVRRDFHIIIWSAKHSLRGWNHPWGGETSFLSVFEGFLWESRRERVVYKYVCTDINLYIHLFLTEDVYLRTCYSYSIEQSQILISIISLDSVSPNSHFTYVILRLLPFRNQPKILCLETYKIFWATLDPILTVAIIKPSWYVYGTVREWKHWKCTWQENRLSCLSILIGCLWLHQQPVLLQVPCWLNRYRTDDNCPVREYLQ